MKARGMSDRRGQRVMGILDIGTSKVAAAVVVVEAGATAMLTGKAPPFRIAGVGLQRSKGVKAGVLTNLDEAEETVRAAIGQAERAAGITVEGVSVSVSCGRLKSQHFAANAEVEDGVVSDEDIARVLQGGRAYAERDGRNLIHLNSIAYRLDNGAGVRDPRGLAAQKMLAQLHAVTADEAPLRNLLALVERCYLSCDGLVATPYASALGVTTEEEREIGVTCIDLGAGTASIAQFADGHLIGADVVPVGSQHVTFDIAKALQTPLVEAERIKTLYGTLTLAQSDEHESFSYPLTGEDDGAAYQTNKARLAEIIRPRIAHILGLVRERLAQNGANVYAGDKVVLTGGASQLLGAAEFAANVWQQPVRIGVLQPVAGLTQSQSGPQFATLAGLATAVAIGLTANGVATGNAYVPQGYMGRVGTWLKAGF